MRYKEVMGPKVTPHHIGFVVEIPPGLNILFEDEHLAVVLKPSGLLSVPGRTPENQDCVTTRYRALRPDCIPQPAVHRLDWETSGILLLARTKDVHKSLSIQFQNREVDKKYLALLEGELAESEGRIELPFRLDVENRPYQIYDEIHGKWGLTEWTKIKVESGHTRVEFRPLTGRTHQLRLHASHPKGLNCPIVGDCLYGTGKRVNDLRLHAYALTFTHPISGARMSFTVEPEW